MGMNGHRPLRLQVPSAVAVCFLVLLLLVFERLRPSRLEYPIPGQYAPPTSVPFDNSQQNDQEPLISMSDDDVQSHIVRDVSDAPKGAEGRWTQAHPAFQIDVPDCHDLSFYARFFIPEVTLRDTGPVTVAALIDNLSLGKQQIRDPGTHELRFPTPAQAVCKSSRILAGLDIDPVWVAKDGTKLGVLLFEIGFEKTQ